MKSDQPLVLSNVFEYDFSSCFYSILENTGMDMTNIPFDDKLQRNITLGILQKNNPRLAVYLNETTKQLIDFYLKENDIKEDEIVIRLKDGFVSRKKLKVLDKSMTLGFKGVISKFIFSVDKNAWMHIYPDGKVVVKGISNKPKDSSFYDLFSNLDFGNRKRIISGLESIRRTIIDSTNMLWFGWEEDDLLIIPIKSLGKVKFRKSIWKSIDPDEIDKNHIWEDYIWPFCRSILIHTEER